MCAVLSQNSTTSNLSMQDVQQALKYKSVGIQTNKCTLLQSIHSTSTAKIACVTALHSTLLKSGLLLKPEQ